jgi:hypothetical protein
VPMPLSKAVNKWPAYADRLRAVATVGPQTQMGENSMSPLYGRVAWQRLFVVITYTWERGVQFKVPPEELQEYLAAKEVRPAEEQEAVDAGLITPRNLGGGEYALYLADTQQRVGETDPLWPYYTVVPGPVGPDGKPGKPVSTIQTQRDQGWPTRKGTLFTACVINQQMVLEQCECPYLTDEVPW